MKKGGDSAPPFFARLRRRYFADFLPLSRCCNLSSMNRFADANSAPDWLIANAPGFGAAPASGNGGGIPIADEERMVSHVVQLLRLWSAVNRTCPPRKQNRRKE